jgi:hypothetical protein
MQEVVVEQRMSDLRGFGLVVCWLMMDGLMGPRLLLARMLPWSWLDCSLIAVHLRLLVTAQATALQYVPVLNWALGLSNHVGAALYAAHLEAKGAPLMRRGWL